MPAKKTTVRVSRSRVKPGSRPVIKTPGVQVAAAPPLPPPATGPNPNFRNTLALIAVLSLLVVILIYFRLTNRPII